VRKQDLPGLVVADLEFHQAIAEAANPVLAHCLRSMGVVIVKSQQISLRRPERHDSVEARHHEVYDAMAGGDAAGAAAAMSRHLSYFSNELNREIETRTTTELGSSAPFSLFEKDKLEATHVKVPTCGLGGQR
jgi:DNA-binding FadR family transcriptional regulator